jgi:nucleotide-binding universal stress UspA family protein
VCGADGVSVVPRRHSQVTKSENEPRAPGIAVDPQAAREMRSGVPKAIIDTAKSKGCDLVVMASHGRHGISAVVLGSETVKVLTHSKIPVLVHR